MDDEKVPSKLETAIERLNQDPYLLAIITAVPGVGGSITQVLTGIGQQIVQERNARLFEQLSEHLVTVEEEALRRDFFETPEGFDLLIKALDESRKTRSDEKRDLIAQILRGALTDYEEKYSPEEYLYLISDLTVQELRVARSIYDGRPDTRSEPWSKWIDKVCTQIGIDTTDLQLSLERIASTGLLQKATTHTDDEGRLYVSVQAYGEGSSFLVTTAFDRLMEFLQLKT